MWTFGFHVKTGHRDKMDVSTLYSLVNVSHQTASSGWMMSHICSVYVNVDATDSMPLTQLTTCEANIQFCLSASLIGSLQTERIKGVSSKCFYSLRKQQ